MALFTLHILHIILALHFIGIHTFRRALGHMGTDLHLELDVIPFMTTASSREPLSLQYRGISDAFRGFQGWFYRPCSPEPVNRAADNYRTYSLWPEEFQIQRRIQKINIKA